jgi:hypothetical protein
MSDISKSSFLYQTPSALKGAARIVSIFGGVDEYRTSNSEEEADANAIRRDWEMVGEDIANATQQYDITKR